MFQNHLAVYILCKMQKKNVKCNQTLPDIVLSKKQTLHTSHSSIIYYDSNVVKMSSSFQHFIENPSTFQTGLTKILLFYLIDVV